MKLKRAIMEVLVEGDWLFYDRTIGIFQMSDFAEAVERRVAEEEVSLHCDCGLSLSQCRYPGCPTGLRARLTRNEADPPSAAEKPDYYYSDAARARIAELDESAGGLS